MPGPIALRVVCAPDGCDWVAEQKSFASAVQAAAALSDLTLHRVSHQEVCAAVKIGAPICGFRFERLAPSEREEGYALWRTQRKDKSWGLTLRMRTESIAFDKAGQVYRHEVTGSKESIDELTSRVQRPTGGDSCTPQRKSELGHMSS